MTATLATVHAIEVAQIGVGEYPPGSNHNKFTDWYGMSGPWCDMSQSWIFTAAGMPMRYAYCPTHIDAFKSLGAWHNGAAGIAMGDLVFYDWNRDGIADHVEWVEAVAGGSLTTLGGNVADRFGRWYRGESQVMGFGRPTYAHAPAPPPVKPGQHVIRPVPTLVKTTSLQVNPQVKYLQIALNHFHGQLLVDGLFGGSTETAVKNFQKVVKILVDGVYGPDTAHHLDEALTAQHL